MLVLGVESTRMKYYLILALAILSSYLSQGQNLIPNGGFEPPNCDLPAWRLHEIIPPWDTMAQAGDWQDLAIMYYGPCSSRGTAGTRDARSGQGCLGLPVYGTPATTATPHESRGYPITPLSQPLVAGTQYQLSYWVKTVYTQSDIIYGTQGPGVLFINNRDELNFNSYYVIENNNAMYNPDHIVEQDDWTQVCMTFTATGRERFMVLGNFRTNANTTRILLDPGANVNSPFSWSYYLIDDIVLIPFTAGPSVLPAEEGICFNEELELHVPENLIGTWDDGSTASSRFVSSPGTYSFTYQDGFCLRTDFVNVREVNCDKCHVYAANAFTPNGDGINDTWKPEFECQTESYRLEVYDRYGNLVFETFDQNEPWTATGNIAKGAYVYRLRFTYEYRGNNDFIDEAGQVTVLE